MRVAITFLLLSLFLFLPNISMAAETAPADTAAKGQAPVKHCPKFSWYKQLGRLSLDGSAEGKASRRDRDAQYVFLNGSKGIHLVYEITPDISPGLYLHRGEPGTLVGELSLVDPGTSPVVGSGKGKSRVSFFLGPDLAPGFDDGLSNGDAAHMRVMEDGPDNGPGIGVRCGVTWRFN
jgi:hypothetical protein